MGVDLQFIGLILLAMVGAVGLIASVFLAAERADHRRVSPELLEREYR